MKAPTRGQWIELAYGDRTEVVRFSGRGIDRQDRTEWWYVDHGAYGILRDDSWIRASSITSWKAADRPNVIVRYACSLGKGYIGRYSSVEAASEAAENANKGLGGVKTFIEAQQ